MAIAAAVILAVTAAPPVGAQTPDFDSQPTGFLTATTGGMPANAWAGTSLATAKRLVTALPNAPRSRALRDLQFKVLVSQLTPPAPDGSPPPSLFMRKVEKIAAMGEAESLNEMVRNAGGYADPAVASTVANALMLAGERHGACAIVKQWQLSEPFSGRAQAACRLLDGDQNAARAANLSSAQQVDGPALMAIALMHAQVPANVLRNAQPAIVRALVGLKPLPIATRIEIAERGEALAIIEATKLGDLYLEALRDGAALPAATARRARMVAAARSTSNPNEMFSSIATAYGEARDSPLFPTIARASAAALINLPAQPQFANVAQEAMRGFLLLGAKLQTQAWIQLALSAVTNNARAIIALDRLVPLAAVAGLDDAKRLSVGEINRWYEVTRDDDATRGPLRGYLLLELLRSTGFDLPPKSTDLPDKPPGSARLVMPPTASLQALVNAAAGGRRAETSLLAPIAANETPLNELHPAAIATIVRALRSVGEDHSARLFAVETAIAYGL
ncbi:hypothetical protein [Reyranella soli]|uniref:hypothetical protein n=1 Tax=Reyranella soli TaxID=1230389 RepID=UPI0014795C25|nr:hypothetical protein [Reyranella soli]